MKQAQPDWVVYQNALHRAQTRSDNGVWALVIVIGENAFSAIAISPGLMGSANGVSGSHDDFQVTLIRVVCWSVLACVAGVCCYFAWRHKSRIAMMFGALPVLFDWADWMFGFLGRPRFTMLGLVTESITTILLAVGLVGAFQYHRLKANPVPGPAWITKSSNG